MSALLAAAHVDTVVARCPGAVSYDRDAWVTAVLAHLEPLPPNRAWLRLSRRHQVAPVSRTVPDTMRRLSPEHGRRPQPRCPEYCIAAHVDDVEVA